MATVDYVQLAITSTRQAFVLAAPHTFIISDGTLRPSGGHRPAGAAGADKVDFIATQDVVPVEPKTPTGRAFMALALRKTKSTFPNMITLGRTANNDLVIPDPSISKLHAIFTPSTKGFELGDAGSKNGTWASGTLLEPRGKPAPLKLGDRLRFGRVGFTVVDAAACWEQIDRMRR